MRLTNIYTADTAVTGWGEREGGRGRREKERSSRVKGIVSFSRLLPTLVAPYATLCPDLSYPVLSCQRKEAGRERASRKRKLSFITI